MKDNVLDSSVDGSLVNLSVSYTEAVISLYFFLFTTLSSLYFKCSNQLSSYFHFSHHACEVARIPELSAVGCPQSVNLAPLVSDPPRAILFTVSIGFRMAKAYPE